MILLLRNRGVKAMLKYRGLKAELEQVNVSDAQVDSRIDRLLEQNRKTIDITGRRTQADDEIVLDYEGWSNGVQFEGGTAQDQTLVLGSGMFIPGFEEQLIGKEIGECADVNVTFPEQYQAEALAGQPAVFHCRIKAIRLKEKYKPDDEFARAMGCESFEALRREIRSQLQEYVDRQAESELRDKLMDQVCEGLDYAIPEEQMNAAVESEMKALEVQLARQNLNLELYCRFTGKTPEQLREDFIPHARRNILCTVAVSEIAKIENIIADEASVAQALEDFCRESGMTMEQLRPYMDEEFQKAMVHSVIIEKVFSLIRESADITVVQKEM